MKVLHVLDHSAPHYDGYAFRSIEIIKRSREIGVETAQMTSAKHGGDSNSGDQETYDGLTYYRTHASGKPWSRLPLLDQWDVVTTLSHRLEQIVKYEKPDLVHAHSPSLNGIAAIRVARRFSLPVVYELRSFWEDAAVDRGVCREGDTRYKLTRALESWVLDRAQQVVCICEGLRQDVANRGVPLSRLSIVPNSVDLVRFAAPDSKKKGSISLHFDVTPGKTLAFIGSFLRFEGLDILIKSVKYLLASDPQIRLLMVGGGAEADGLQELTAREGVAEAVRFTGRVPQVDVGNYYDAVDLLVYPRIPMRLTELVTPLKPLEAMAMGRNVLASDVGGHRELIRHDETGLLFRAGDPQDLARQAMRLLKDEQLAARLRGKALDYVKAERNWNVNIKRYLPIYEKALLSVDAGINQDMKALP